MFGYIIIGAAGYVDRVVLGSSHIYQSPTCKEIYDTKIPYDPEGINHSLEKNTHDCFQFINLSNFILHRFHIYINRYSGSSNWNTSMLSWCTSCSYICSLC